MKIAGTQTVKMSPQQVYDLLHDPVILARCMPGCESLELIGDHEYAMKMKMVLASVSGLFQGKIRTADPNPPESFRLIVEGAGKIGFMKGDGALKLSPSETGTTVDYDGDVQIGGTIAAVGQRLIDTTSKMMIKKFFERLATQTTALAAD